MASKRYSDQDEIQDVKLFRKLLVTLKQKWGSGNKAAAEIGIGQATFSRLEHKKQGDKVSRANMMKLQTALAAVAPRHQHDFARCIMGTAGQRLWGRIYLPWCRERTSRLVNRRAPHWQITSGDAAGMRRIFRAHYSWRGISRDQLMRMTRARMRRDFPEVWSQGEVKLRRSGVSAVRLKVALARIVEPLAEFADSGFVEPTWNQLSKAEQRRYLRSAFAQELLLLPRPHDGEKAREIAATLKIDWSPRQKRGEREVNVPLDFAPSPAPL